MAERHWSSQGFDHHNYCKKQRSGCKEQAKRMTKRQYFATCLVAVFKSVKSLRNKKSIRECLLAPSHLWAALGGFLMTRPKVFSCFQSTGWKKENCHRIWQREGCWGASAASWLGQYRRQTHMWRRSHHARPALCDRDLQKLIPPWGLSIPLLRVHHHYSVHMAV